MTGTMTCKDGVRVLMDFTEGLLPVALRRRIEEHVEGCRRCRGFVRSYGETPRILREATEARMPASLRRRLRRAIGAAHGRDPRR